MVERGKNPAFVCVGKIGTPHGVHGKVKIRTYTKYPEDINSYGDVYLSDESIIEIKDISASKDGVIASIEGVDYRDEAEKLKGKEIFVSRDKLPETGKREFYYFDLEGLQVRGRKGNNIGKIISVDDFGAGSIIEVEFLDGGKKEMLPLNKKIFPEINIEEGYVVLDFPEVIFVQEEK